MKMKCTRRHVLYLTVLGSCVAGNIALAQGQAEGLGQAYPSRPIRFIVAFAPGSATDLVARLVGQNLGDAWGQNVVVENRPGAGGIIGSQVAKRANPDGYTILVTSGSFVINVSLHRDPGYAITDFVPIAAGPVTPNIIIAHPSVKASTLQELIALARTKPMSYASSGTGTSPHLDMEQLFTVNSKVDIAHVPMAPPQAVAAVVGNQVPFGCTAMPPTTPHIQAGRLRALAVTSARRSDVLPNVPTMAEVGFKGQEADTLQGMMVPAGTPKSIVTRLHSEIVKIAKMPDVSKRVLDLGFDIIANSPEQFSAQVRTEVEKWGKVVKGAGIKVE